MADTTDTRTPPSHRHGAREAERASAEQSWDNEGGRPTAPGGENHPRAGASPMRHRTAGGAGAPHR